MSNRLALSVVQSRLTELIAEMRPGDELLLTQNDETVAVVTKQAPHKEPRQPGTAAHYKHWMSDDFNDSMDENGEYVK
jgi:antitoxin (DNA-binding transcriptional repressor) of toxin-antitoxin stability system